MHLPLQPVSHPPPALPPPALPPHPAQWWGLEVCGEEIIYLPCDCDHPIKKKEWHYIAERFPCDWEKPEPVCPVRCPGDWPDWAQPPAPESWDCPEPIWVDGRPTWPWWPVWLWPEGDWCVPEFPHWTPIPQPVCDCALDWTCSPWCPQPVDPLACCAVDAQCSPFCPGYVDPALACTVNPLSDGCPW